MANTLLDAIQPFVWGPGGAKKTPDEIAKDRELAAAALLKAGNTAPVDHWTQGAARVADALAGVIRQRRAEAAGAENAQYNSSLISNILGGNAASDASSSGTIPSPAASGEIAATSPSQSIDMTGNDVYSGFMDTVKAGGVTNPYALAAIAATGKAESGFSPGNVNRTWSDPSESGQAGTAGGILSWRGPRYQALAATGDLSPAGQAKFFLGENPQLIQSLQNAKSVEEAQSLMNGAWKFAGYNRPGGEAARRLGYANSFLPTFQGGGEVASVDPQSAFNAAMPELNAGIPANADPIVRQNMTVPSLADEVADFRNTPEFLQAYPGGYNQQPLSDQQFNDRFGGEQPALPVAAAEVAQQPVQQAQATPVQVAQASQGQSSAVNEAIIRAISDPRATQETKAIAQALLQQQLNRQQAQEEMRLKQADPAYQLGLDKTRLEIENMRNPRLTPGDQLAREKFDWERQNAGQTNDIKNYQFYADREIAAGREPLGPLEWEVAQKKAGAASTNVTVGEGDKFYEALDKKNAETFSALSEEGMRGRSKLAQIDRLDQLLANAPVGGGAALKLLAGEYGINTEGVSDLQAAQALINELVPQQRQPGSGPMSDADLALFKQSLPRVINQPDGNRMIIQTMRGITEYQVKMGEIADAVANRELTAQQGRDAIRKLDNPLDGYTKAVRQMDNDAQDGKASVPDGIDPADWEFMTPEERRLFE